MTTLTLTHIKKLVELEAQVQYDSFPPNGQVPYEVIDCTSSVLLSAPHGAKTFRQNDKEIWHEEDEYTAGMSLLIAEICGISAIVMKWKCRDYDPNYTNRDDLPYKKEVGKLINEKGVHYVIDLHGAALFSEKLDSDQTIDLGTRQQKADDPPSINLAHVNYLEGLLGDVGGQCEATNFVVRRNRFPASGPGTITTFASKHKIPNTDVNVEAIQIEMKPQVRVAQRFPAATLYKSCGPFDANPTCVLHMLQSLANFVEYLKERVN